MRDALSGPWGRNVFVAAVVALSSAAQLAVAQLAPIEAVALVVAHRLAFLIVIFGAVYVTIEWLQQCWRTLHPEPKQPPAEDFDPQPPPGWRLREPGEFVHPSEQIVFQVRGRPGAWFCGKTEDGPEKLDELRNDLAVAIRTKAKRRVLH